MHHSEKQPRPNMTLCRRLAAEILGCGRNKVAFNVGQENQEEHLANIYQKLRQQIKLRSEVRKLITTGHIYQRDDNNVSRYRFRRHAEAKSKGRHTGYGKRHGTRNARMPGKTLWIERIRAQRRVLCHERGNNRSCTDSNCKKLTPSEYHTFYYRVKGNQFKHKRALMEAITNMRQEKLRQASLEARNEAAKSAALIRNARARAALSAKK